MNAPAPSSKRSPARRPRLPAAASPWEPVWNGPEVEAEIVAGGLTSSGLRARTLQSGHVSGRHFGGAGPANAAVYVRSRDAGRARLLLEDRDEGHRVVRAGMDSIGRDFRLIVTLSAALVLAVLAVALVVTVLGPA